MSDIIDINVGETIEEVTINVVDNLITVNINKVTGGGGSPTLQQVTTEGNETSNAIIVTDNSENETSLTNRGITFVDLDEGGDTALRFLNTSTANQEIEIRGLGGTMALTSDITTPTLQQVTDEGNETTQRVKVIEADIKATELGQFGLKFFDLENEGNTTLAFQETSTENTITLKAETGTLALLSDIPSSSTFVPYTGATTNVDLGTHSITAKDLIVTHSSGSGDAATITKGGNGEALKVSKTSGSGNAASITGGVTLLDELHLNTDLADAYIASASVWNGKFTLPALTSGSVLFSNGSTIAQDNAQLFWDDTNNRLGIGATSPQARLDVRAQGALLTDIAFRVRNSADTANLLELNGAGGISINSTTQGFLPPRMTTTQKNAIASPAAGLVVYDTTLQSLSNYNGTAWIGAVDDLQISLISQVYS